MTKSAFDRQPETPQEESDILLRSAIDTIGEAFALYDPDDRLVFFNERYREIYRLSAPMIEPGRRFEEIIRYGVAHGQYPQAHGNEEAWIAKRLASHRCGNTDFIQEIEGGRWINIKEKRTPTGHIVGFRVDVTEIYRAKEAAEAASRAKSEFLANMSHEIRTPMNALLGLTRQVLDMPLEARQRELLGKALDSGQALLRILNNILDYSKIEANCMDLEATPLSIDTVLAEIGSLFSAQLAAKGLGFFIDIAPGTPAHVVGDPLRLHQVLANLVGNAIKFTERGEILVRVAASDPTAGGKVVLHFAVQDTGPGFPAESAAQLFQPFTQADSSITRRYGGTGLGLAICERLVRLMGGEISASATSGVGATFRFSILAERADDSAQPHPARKKSAPARRQDRPAPAALDGENLAVLLHALRHYLVERELIPDDLLQTLDTLAGATSDAALARLLSQIDEFDHEGALATVTQIAAQHGFPLHSAP